MRGFVVCVLSSMLIAGGALAAPRQSAETAPEAGRFDGAWTIDVRRTVGNCPALVPEAIEIRRDLVVGTGVAPASSGGTAHWGYVDGDGTIVTRFTAPGHVARAHGQLRGNFGQGAWSSSTDMCGGTWRAQRGGAQRAGN